MNSKLNMMSNASVWRMGKCVEKESVRQCTYRKSKSNFFLFFNFSLSRRKLKINWANNGFKLVIFNLWQLRGHWQQKKTNKWTTVQYFIMLKHLFRMSWKWESLSSCPVSRASFVTVKVFSIATFFLVKTF